MKKYYLEIDTDLNEFFKKLWKEKIFILIITIFFSLLFYFYHSSLTKKFRAQIDIEIAPKELFIDYDRIYKLYYDSEFISVFNSNLQSNFLSKNNLEKFLEQSKDFKNSHFFKKNINKNNYSEYFILKSVKQTTYSLIFPEGLYGEKLLIAYIDYTKNITLKESKNKLIIELKKITSRINSDLEIAKKIEPVLQSNNDVDQFYNFKILSNRIIIINNLIEKLDKAQFNYDVKLIELFVSYKPIRQPISSFYPYLVIVLGYFLAVLIVIFRDKIKRK
jgi:LPS O-antigen subunit length determinant protein (WzzB/FepE family)